MSKRIQPQAISDEELEPAAIIEEQHREFLLNALRAASLRAKLMDADLTTIGVALRNNLIGADTALSWARDAGLLEMIGSIPEPVGRIAKANQETQTEEANHAIPEA